MSIEKKLNLKYPIVWNDFAIEHTFAKFLIDQIILQQPVNIVELGSGLSTLLILKIIQKLGYKPNFYSFDSDSHFLNETQKVLISEGVFSDNIHLVFSPISDLSLSGSSYKWYNTKDFKFGFDKIDLLVIDGPLGALCKNARYPALVILKNYIKNGTLILLDDANRQDEKEIINLWKNEFPEILHISNINNKRGGVMIQF
jgi:predicted O-methyltransferase YrrM